MPDPTQACGPSGAGWEEETDLVVIGAGAGGMAAALVGALEGLQVSLCERSSQVGGTAATSAGTLWIPGNRHGREAGHQDTAEAAAVYLDALVDDEPGRALRRTYLAEGPAVLDYLESRSEVRFVSCGMHPDYLDLPGAGGAGRAVIPESFDGRLLGRAFRNVRPPIPEFMVLGGMMVGKADIPPLVERFRSPSNFFHAARLATRYVLDRVRGYPRGTRLVMGNALVGRLYYSLRRRQVPICLQTGLVDLVLRDGQVEGAIVETRGVRRRIKARRGVVLATGGYAHDAAMRALYMPDPVPARSLASPDNQGAGISAGLRAGARIDTQRYGSGAFWTPVSVTRHQPAGGLFPHLSLDRAKPGLIAVDQTGRRFVNEAASYHDFGLAMFAADRTRPAIPAYLVCESRFVRKYGLGCIHPGTTDLAPHVSAGYLTCADTLDELAAALDIPAADLLATVRRYNVQADAGRDDDFGKGTTALNRFNGDPAHGPNPCLAPIQTGPFCALAVWPAEIACSAGLATDSHARVLDAQDRPIDGLYACGNDMGSIMGGAYPGPGTTLGPALVFGYLAAMHARTRR
ncbi:FAD-binding protein [Pigmentiphaga kullae]|uniref:Succinate dehydrogenase/fumarate reductase flavoprotein subunit n=1 Tax=Pigmentiphaga kullae TaxID=151784 RepID=A0A4Q7NHN2_9BURK|nr:FAD-binding protein [Pigmentiphaga kullae]RZS84399.1 succinate dehydrogenase/fumarate reductase flavoprotein subunit [Pigmentiphaga kullae]